MNKSLQISALRQIIKDNRHRAIEAGLHAQLISRLLDTGVTLHIVRRIRNNFYGQ